MAETIGQRLYRIRLAWGDGVRDPESLEKFAVRVKRETGEDYSEMTLSNLERMKQKWRLEHIEIFAVVDKLKRGRAWLAWGDSATEEATPTPAQYPAEEDIPVLDTRPKQKARRRKPRAG